MSVLSQTEILNNVAWDGAANTSTTSVTVPSGASTIVIAAVSDWITPDSVTFNAVAATQQTIQNDGDSVLSYIYTIAAPAAGTYDMVITCVAAASVAGFVLCVSEDTIESAGSISANTTSITNTRTTAVDDLVIDVVSYYNSPTTATVGAGQTEIDNTGVDWKATRAFAISSEVATSASTDLSWSFAPGARSVSSAIVLSGAAPAYTITSIDGDNNVQAGQTSVDIVMTATTGVTSVTLGGESLTINGVT